MTEGLPLRGPAFPLTVGPRGGLVESAGEDRIDQSVRIILGTQHGERVMRPTFGCNLRSLTFSPNDAATANLARHLVEAGLSRWEPRIDLVDVQVANDVDAGALTITVQYRIRGTAELRSAALTFPLGTAA